MSVAKPSSGARIVALNIRVAPARGNVKRPIRLGLFGLFGTGNFGNDASLDAVLSFIRRERPDATAMCICGTPEIVGPRFGIPTTRINCRQPKGWKATLNRFFGDVPREVASTANALLELWRLDLMIIPGTGILDDFGTGPFGMPYALFRWCLVARLIGTRVLFVNIGAGPIRHPLSRFFMKSAAHLANYRSYRDDISREYMKSIGVDVKNDPVYPDVAFDLPLPPQASRAPDSRPRVIGVGLMSYNGWRGDITKQTGIYDVYMFKITQFVKRVLEEGYHVRLFSGDEYDSGAIIALAERLLRDIPDRLNDKLIVEPAHSIYDVMRQIADTEVVIATRYHNVVAALIMNKPTLSIGYAAKNDVLLGRMGLGDYCQHIESIDLELLMLQFHKLLANRDLHERILEETNLIFRQRLQHQQEVLLRDFFPGGPDLYPAVVSPASPRMRSQPEFDDANN